MELRELIEWYRAEADRHQRHGGEFADIAQAFYGRHAETARILSVIERVQTVVTVIYPLAGDPNGMKIEGPADALRDLAEVLKRE